jgi:AcrR family transcriptional regulator
VPPPSDRPNRRQIAADATRDEILRAARRLFAADGYSATSVQAIATEAGVAVQTIYSSIGSKAAIAVALNDTIDTEAGVMALAMEAMDSSDPRRIVGVMVAIPRRIGELCGDLIAALDEARLTDPVAAAVVVEGERRHREGEGLLLARLEMLGALRPGLDLERTADLLSALVAQATFARLVFQGWSWDEADATMVAVLSQLLLADGE